MAKARYRRVPVQRSDGRVQVQRVRADRLREEYGVVVVNARGRKAFVRKSSEVRALEAARGSTGTLRRVRLTLKANYNARGKREDGEARGGHKLKLEADLVVVIDEENLQPLKDDLVAYAAEQAANFGLGEEDFEVNEVSNEPASDAITGVDYADVLFRHKRNDTASGAIRDHVQSLVEAFGVESDAGDEEPDEDVAESLRRAVQRIDKLGRTYWVDPETGRRTLNPELVR